MAGMEFPKKSPARRLTNDAEKRTPFFRSTRHRTAPKNVAGQHNFQVDNTMAPRARTRHCIYRR